MANEKSCGAVVIRFNDESIEYLAAKSARAGHWGFPKGHVEAGETEEQTALREVWEEVGLSVKLLDGFRISVDYPLHEGAVKEVVFYLGMAPDQPVNIREAEVQEARWLGYDDMMHLLTFDNSRRVLSEAKRFLDQRKPI